MFPGEATWIGSVVTGLTADDFPMLNVGSQTAEFRRVDQPWIDEEVFGPLRAAERNVIHVDIKADEGVDLVADIATPGGRATIAEQGARSILCSNLLEHVSEPERFLDDMIDLLPVGGHLIVTGPTEYPHHPDPIDNLFRPTSQEMIDLLSDTMTIIDATRIEAGTYGTYTADRHGRMRLAVRLAMPFRRPARWREMVRWLRRPISAYCVHATKPL